MNVRTKGSKLVVWLLALVMVLSLLPTVGASAANKSVSVQNGNTVNITDAKVGDVYTITVTGFSQLSSGMTWKSENTSVAQLSNTSRETGWGDSVSGTVTIKAAGSAKVTVYYPSASKTTTINFSTSGSGGGEQAATSVTYILYVGNSGGGNNAGVEVARKTVENVSASDVSAQQLKKSHVLANEVFGASVTGKEGLSSSDMYSESATWDGSGPYTVKIYIKKTGQSSVSGAYTLSYNGNGNTSGTAPESMTVLGGKTYTVADKGTLAKTNSSFSGWNTQANGNGNSYAVGANIIISADTTLYAQWAASAEESDPEPPEHVKAYENGKITLSVTGRDVASTTTVPGQSTSNGHANIALALDLTSSMQETFGGTTRIAALRTAVMSFLNKLPLDSQTKVNIITYWDADYHFASSSTGWKDFNENGRKNLLSTAEGLNYSYTTNYATDQSSALVKAGTELNNVLNNGNSNYVILFTDGEPQGGSGYSSSLQIARGAVNNAKNLKALGVDIYAVGILDSANASAPMSPAMEMTFNSLYGNFSGVDVMMNGISSNYPEATAGEISGSEYSTQSCTVTMGEGGNNGYYLLGSNANELNEQFKSIGDAISEEIITTTDHTKGVAIKDKLSENVELSNSSNANYGVTVTASNNSEPDFSVDYDASTREITIRLFGELTDSVTYTASIPVKASNIAQTKANNAATDSVRLPTNDGAFLTYQYGEKDPKTSDYGEEPKIEVEKEFYLHHSSTDEIETIKWSELKSDGTYNVTEKVPTGLLYGGLFKKDEYKDPTDLPGTELKPQGGATYYMREPSQDYLLARNVATTYGGNVIGTYAVAVADCSNYSGVGFIYNDKPIPSANNTLYESATFNNVHSGTDDAQMNDSLKPADFMPKGSTAADTAVLAVAKLCEGGAAGQLQAYWITKDGVKVVGDTIRTLSKGRKVKDDIGKSEVVETEAKVSKTEMPVQSIFVPGNNEEEEELTEDTGVKLAGYTTSLNGNIAMNFYMELSDDVAADENAYMQFTLPGANTTAEKVMLTDAAKQTRDGKTYYVFSAGVAAKEMTSDIKAQFVKGDGTKSPEWTYTIKEYCDYIRSHADDYDAESISLAENMLLYGGNAQKYFQYNLDKQADADVDLALPEVDLDASFDPVVKGTCEGLTYAGSSAMLTTTTGLRHYFEFDGNAGDYTFKANGKKLTVESDKNGKYVLVGDIKAKNLNKPITLKVTDKSGNEFTLSYSVYTNVKQVVTGNFEEVDQNLMKALYGYGEAALAYFASRA